MAVECLSLSKPSVDVHGFLLTSGIHVASSEVYIIQERTWRRVLGLDQGSSWLVRSLFAIGYVLDQ